MPRSKNFSSVFTPVAAKKLLKASSLVSHACIGAVWIYRRVFSLENGTVGRAVRPILPYGYSLGCRFFPSCSAYAADAVRQYGLLRGAMVSLTRIARCHPWSPGGYDPIK